MERELLRNAEKYHKKRHKKKIWQRVISVLGCAVVFCVTYALVLPAITEEKEVYCGMEEHVHDDSCYAQLVTEEADRLLICTLEEKAPHVHEEVCYELQGHAHTDSCYQQERGELLCQLPEEEGHAHTEPCYEQGDLTCTAQENHVHGEGCYTPGDLVCTVQEGHIHADICYADGVLICTEPENHAHGAECYGADVLTCTEPENHVHDSTCYQQTLICEVAEAEGHTHSDDCYQMTETLICTLEESPEQQVLVCTLEEYIPESEEELHVHGDACYVEAEAELTCQLPEDENHTHGDRCYGTWELICGMQEHTHDLRCAANPNADLENRDLWEQTFADVELTDVWAEDVLAIAETQLGYRESQKNYVVLDGSNETKGYTRYGAWYGIPYGDWCAMFVSFCLDYAGVEEYPLDCNCPSWINALTELEMYQTPDVYTPVPGDLIFFDWNENLVADHVGLVKEVDAETGEITTIEGNNGNTVAEHTYEFDDTDILGYGNLPQQLTEEERAQVDQVISMIDAMPSADDIEAKTAEFSSAGDEEGKGIWLEATNQQVIAVYHCYEQLSEMLKPHVSNAEKLLELEHIWRDQDLTSVAHVHDESCYVSTAELSCRWVSHEHTEDCYTADGILICTISPEEVHEHTDSCYEKVLSCAIAQEPVYYCGWQAHTHSEACVDENGNQICGLEAHVHFAYCEDPNAKSYCWFAHPHLEDCFDPVKSLVIMIDLMPTAEEAETVLQTYGAAADWDSFFAYQQEIKDMALPVYEAYQNLTEEEQAQVGNSERLLALSRLWQEPIYLCGMEAHTHGESCFDGNGEPICALTEHTHYERCEDPTAEPYCWLVEHTHDEVCMDESGTAICSVDPHTHDARCFDRVLSIVVMIDALPTSEEAEEILLAYEEAEDWEGYGAYQKKVADLAWPLYYACEDLSEEELTQVTNYDLLMELSWLWSATTYATDISKVTYNPEYTTDNYHTQWETPGGWITESTDSRVHINEVVPDAYAIDGLVIGAKSADSVTASFSPLYSSIPTETEAENATGFSWTTLAGSGMDCTLGANLILPSDEDAKEALLNSNIYAWYENIGTYDGHEIDLKIALVDYENYVDWKNGKVKEGVLGFWTQDTRSNQPTYGQRLPGISVCGISWVQVRYTFFDSATGAEIDVKGSTSFYDLDFAQAIHVRAGDTKLKGIYVTNVNDSVPDLDTVNALTTRAAQRNYFETWTVDDCVLKFSNVPPESENGNIMSGVVVYSSHGNDSGLNSEQYGDTKHAFTLTFERNNISIVYSFDKGKKALSGSATAEKPAYTRNANGGIIHSAVPVYTGSLEIQKEVSGAYVNMDDEFQFRIEFFKSGTTIDDSLDGKFGDVILVDGIGTFTLKHGESVKITGIPIREAGTRYTVTELTTDGYAVETSMSDKVLNGTLTTDGPYAQSYYSSSIQADNVMEQHQIVTFENFGGASLPETGGAGSYLYTVAGLLLMLSSAGYLMYRYKKRRRGVL